MRLGALVYGWKTASEWADAHVKMNYRAAYWPLPDGDKRQGEFIAAARDADLVIAEVGVWNNMLDPDPTVRAKNIENAIRRLETAEAVGARCCVNISGSRSAIWDGPHMLNLTDETFDMNIETACRIIDAVKPEHTYFTFEPMPWMYPTCAADVKRMARAIDRKAFAAHADMANIINSYEKYVHNADLTREFFGELGGMIKSVHLKDSRVIPDRLTLHIDEALPGEGEFDFGALFDCCRALDADLPVMIEHLPDESTYLRARANILRLMEA